MTEWTRVSLTARCAYCGNVLRDGDPVLAVQVDNPRYRMKRPFYYCIECRGPAPPDLAPPPERGTIGNSRTKPATMIGQLSIADQLRARIGKHRSE